MTDRVQPIRVLAVIPGTGPTQLPAFMDRQLRSLSSMNVDVRTFYLESRTSPRQILHCWQKFRRTCAEYRPHLVHAHYGTVTALFCGLATCLPLVVTLRGSDLNPEPDSGFIRPYSGILLSQLAVLRAAALLCVSPNLQQRLWWRKGGTQIVPTGVNCELFKPCAKHDARQALGFAADERIVLFNVGYRAKLKGRELYDAALRIARSELPAIRSVVLDGSTPSERIPLYMNAADCLVVASVFEGSPNIVKEAMACNLPVASVDVGDVAERLRMVSPSRIVKRDAGELGHAIVELLTLQTRSNGREQILSTCSEDRIAAAIRAVYDSVLQNGAGPSVERTLPSRASRAASGNL